MSDTPRQSVSGLGAVLRVGRLGAETRQPGVTVVEIHGAGFASITARRHQRSALAEAVATSFGVELPISPRRVEGREMAFIWAGPDQWLAQATPSATATAPNAGSIDSAITSASHGGAGNLPQALPLSGFVDMEAELAPRLGKYAAIADQSHGRVLLRIAGPRVRDALAKGVSIDLHPRAFGPGHVAMTTAAHIGMHIWQLDDGPTYGISTARSSAASFWHWLQASSAEFGLEILPPVGASDRVIQQ